MFKRLFIVTLFISSIIYANNREISLDLGNDFTIESNRGFTEFSGVKTYGETGGPGLPVVSGIFLVPPEADLNSVSLSIEGLKESLISGINIRPLPPLMTCERGAVWPDDKEIVDGKDVAIYNQNKFFPEKYIDAMVVGGLANYKIVRYMVYLTKYNPVTSTLKRLERGKLVVNYEPIKGYNKQRNAKYKITPYAKKMINLLATNASQFLDAYDAEFTYTSKPVYLFMTTSEVQNGLKNFNALVESKKGKGFDVKIITDSDWGGGTGDQAADNIRKWLQANYKEMGASHVLFIGSPHPSNSKVAMKVITKSLKPPTDFYFGEISGDESNFMNRSDCVVELSVGRICVFSSSEYAAVDKAIERIITYENAPKETIGWRKKALFAAKGWDAQSKCSDLFEAIKERYALPNDWKVYRIYSTNLGNPEESSCSQTKVTNAWNKEKPGFVPWATHGNTTGSSGIMNSSGTAKLVNTDFPSIAFMGACTNADPKKSSNLSHTYFKNHGIAGIANTVSSYYRPGQKNWMGSNYQAGAIYMYSRGILEQKLPAGGALDYMRAQSMPKKDCWNNTCSHNIYGCPDVGVESFGGGTPITEFNQKVSNQNLIFMQLKNNFIHLNNVKEGLTVTIVNSAGKTLNKFNAVKQNTRIPLKSFSSGLYFCVIKTKAATSKYKFIKF